MKLYKVTFTFNQDWRQKVAGLTSVTLVVESYDQFYAQQKAWDQIAVLNPPEPLKIEASLVSKDS